VGIGISGLIKLPHSNSVPSRHEPNEADLHDPVYLAGSGPVVSVSKTMRGRGRRVSSSIKSASVILVEGVEDFLDG
jgi:hypothetical protein